jgi:hypothetical protein
MVKSDETSDISYQPIASCELFNMSTMSSSIKANINVPRASHTAILIPATGVVLSCGGVSSNNTALADCEGYIPYSTK